MYWKASDTRTNEAELEPNADSGFVLRTGVRPEWDSSLGPARSKTGAAAISSATELLQQLTRFYQPRNGSDSIQSFGTNSSRNTIFPSYNFVDDYHSSSYPPTTQPTFEQKLGARIKVCSQFNQNL
uniref:Uncharacterized protein n=1 Tax=Anopheles culicifacies TaxID=139723 RepID=A0A182M174_9DIPT